MRFFPAFMAGDPTQKSCSMVMYHEIWPIIGLVFTGEKHGKKPLFPVDSFPQTNEPWTKKLWICFRKSGNLTSKRGDLSSQNNTGSRTHTRWCPNVRFVASYIPLSSYDCTSTINPMDCLLVKSYKPAKINRSMNRSTDRSTNPIVVPGSILVKWRFPKMGVPQSSSILDWDFPWNKPFSELGEALLMEPPI